MNDMNSIESKKSYDEIDLREIFWILWHGKRQILIIATIFSLFGLIYALTLPNIYRSEAILASSQDSNDLSGTMQSFSGIASLAGIDLPEGEATKSDQALEVISSKSFFIDKFFPEIFLPDLMANPRWDPESNSLNYDSDLYNYKEKKWVRNVGFPYQVIPTAQEAYQYFTENIIDITTDKATGFVRLNIKHVSPHIAKDWADLIIKQINEQFRERDYELAILSIKYLNNQIAKTSVVEVKEALSQLLQRQIQTSMMTEAKKDYIFMMLDPPLAPETKFSPKRFSIFIFTTLLGILLGIFIVFVKYYARRGKT